MRCTGRGSYSGPLLRQTFPVRNHPHHGIVWNRVQGMGRGVKRIVEAEKGRERKRERVEE